MPPTLALFQCFLPHLPFASGTVYATRERITARIKKVECPTQCKGRGVQRGHAYSLDSIASISIGRLSAIPDCFWRKPNSCAARPRGAYRYRGYGERRQC